MDMFEKTTKKVKEVGGNMIDSAKYLGTAIYNSSKEQGEMAGMRVQKSVIEKKMQELYAVIGEKYVDYINKADSSVPFDVAEVLEELKVEADKLAEIEAELQEREMNIKRTEAERRQKRAQDVFDCEKAKLDKALSMEILSQEEYEEKIAFIQKKLDNHEQLRRIEMQLQMGIITKEEYTEKIDKILG